MRNLPLVYESVSNQTPVQLITQLARRTITNFVSQKLVLMPAPPGTDKRHSLTLNSLFVVPEWGKHETTHPPSSPVPFCELLPPRKRTWDWTQTESLSHIHFLHVHSLALSLNQFQSSQFRLFNSRQSSFLFLSKTYRWTYSTTPPPQNLCNFHARPPPPLPAHLGGPCLMKYGELLISRPVSKKNNIDLRDLCLSALHSHHKSHTLYKILFYQPPPPLYST